jgi:tRNA(Ile2) C34 agmatinyltransferase TiaS
MTEIDWPDCPRCGTDRYVAGADSYYRCFACDNNFEAEQ